MEHKHLTLEWDAQLQSSHKAVHIISPAPRDIWEKLVEADDNALVTQTPQWLDAITAAGAYQDASRCFEFPDGSRLVLPLVRRARVPFGLSIEASFPEGWGMGGLVGPGSHDPEALAVVFEDFERRKVLHASIRPNPLAGSAWAAARPARVFSAARLAHVLDLTGGFEHVWAHKFAPTLRTNVRKAEKSGLEIQCDTTGSLIPLFYELFLRSVERWAQQQHEPIALARWRATRRDSIEKFQTIARSIGDAFRLWVAYKDGKPAAAIMVLLGKNANYTRGAMDKDLAGPTRANALLHRLAIEEACQAGCQYYHMGETGSSSSLAQFKGHLGADPVSYAEYYPEHFPITRFNRGVRSLVKRIIGFKDAN